VAAYATGADLVARYDIDLLGDLATDDREELDRAAIPNHPNILAALLDASGEIDAAMMAGGRYTPAQLAGITDNTRNHLIRITCACALANLIERRPERATKELADAFRKTANGHLNSLRNGENVFGIAAVVDSGTIAVETVQSVEIDSLNLLPSRMAPYFPGTDTRTSRAR
jgi:phage gp36-like protein